VCFESGGKGERIGKRKMSFKGGDVGADERGGGRLPEIILERSGQKGNARRGKGAGCSWSRKEKRAPGLNA